MTFKKKKNEKKRKERKKGQSQIKLFNVQFGKIYHATGICYLCLLVQFRLFCYSVFSSDYSDPKEKRETTEMRQRKREIEN